jgi:hypothetical protein
MALKRRKPGSIVKKAEKRLKGMKKIDGKYDTIFDYGGPNAPLSSKEVKQQIQLCFETNKQYNEALKIADDKVELLKEAESKLTEMYSRILSGCVSKFGIDATEITLLGGTRKSERKKMKRKNKIIQ